jgi:hypothetical protein
VSWPVAIVWVEQALHRGGWVDHQMVDETPFCTPACQDAWLAVHPCALDPVAVSVGLRRVGQSYQWLDETDIDRWCAGCGVLIQVGTEEAERPAGACPPLVVNRLRSADGGALRRVRALAAAPRAPARPSRGAPVTATGCGPGRRLPTAAPAARPGHTRQGRGWSPG